MVDRLSVLSPPDELLDRRLRALGLRGIRAVRTHANRTVMLSIGRNRVLRIHRGYAGAPDRVLRAIVRFLQPHRNRAERKAAEREFLAWPVEAFGAKNGGRIPDRPRPGDLRILNRLASLHESLNRRYFDGRLSAIPFRLSARMRTRLGEVSVDTPSGRALEIALSREHLSEHTWHEVEETVLHEMVHQWQAENGFPVDHGPIFRRKAEEVGVEPRARRQRGIALRREAGRQKYETG